MDRRRCRLSRGNATPTSRSGSASTCHAARGPSVGRFSDGEIRVEILENVRGRDVFLVQSTCPPANDNLMELLVHGRTPAGGLRRHASPRSCRTSATPGRIAGRVRPACRSPPSWWRSMIAAAGVDRVLTVDLHAGQIQGFFDIPVDNVYASPVLLGGHLAARSMTTWWSCRPTWAAWCAPAPSRSGWRRRPRDHRQAAPAPNEAEVMNIIGDVEGKAACWSTTWSTPRARCATRPAR